MTSTLVGWYGPLIDLSQAASHVGQFVQLLVFIHRATPVQYKLANGGEIIRKDIQVGDNTRSFFSVSIWHKSLSSLAVAGDIVLLQNVKITKFRDVIEAKTVQCSSLVCLVHYNESLVSKDVDELVQDCQLGVTTKEKLRKLIGWVQKAGFVVRSIKPDCYRNGQLPKNWKAVDNVKSWTCFSLAEVSRLKSSCRAIFRASIGEIFLPIMWKDVGEVEKEKMFISRRLSETKDDGLVEDIICTGCQLCGSPLDTDNRSIFAKSSAPLYCQRSSNRLHVVGHIYRPFMLYVWDDLDYIPIYVTNKGAEQLFGSIKAERVYLCHKRQKHYKRPFVEDVGLQTSYAAKTNENLRAHKDLIAKSWPPDETKSQEQKEKDQNKTINLYFIWLILLKMLLCQGRNSPLKFEIAVNPSVDAENGRFELFSVSMPCGNTK